MNISLNDLSICLEESNLISYQKQRHTIVSSKCEFHNYMGNFSLVFISLTTSDIVLIRKKIYLNTAGDSEKKKKLLTPMYIQFI